MCHLAVTAFDENMQLPFDRLLGATSGPLTHSQLRLWSHMRLRDSRAREYHLVKAMRITGPLDVTALVAALETVASRHDALRLRFQDADPEPRQEVDAGSRVCVERAALAPLDASEIAIGDAAEQAARDEFEKPLDPRDSVCRIRLLEIDSDDHILLRTTHHIISDEWSENLFQSEWWAAYTSLTEGETIESPTPSLGYVDFARWQRGECEPGIRSGLAHWVEELEGCSPELPLPVVRSTAAASGTAAWVHRCLLDAAASKRLRDCAAAHGVSLYMFLAATLAALLAKICNQDDVVICSPMANRRLAALEKMLGLFANVVPLRVRLDRKQPFAEVLRTVKRVVLKAWRHQDVPLDWMVKELALRPRLDAAPFGQVSFAWQNAPPTRVSPPHLTLTRVDHIRPYTTADLELQGWEESGSVRLTWWCRRDRFDQAQLIEWADQYARILATVTAQPAIPVYRISLFALDERQRLTSGWQ